MARNKQPNVTRTAQPPPQQSTLEDAVVENVLQRFDTAALAEELSDKVASKLASTIRVDELAETLLSRKQEQLSARLMAGLLEKMGL
jgi:hypothetical protein